MVAPRMRQQFPDQLDAECRARIQAALEAEPGIAFGMLFGSLARGTASKHSDLDLAVSIPGILSARELLDLRERLESAAGRKIDLLRFEDAPASIAYRIFKEGIVLSMRDRATFVEQKAKAILEYFDWKPFEDILVRGALRAAQERRG